MTFFLSLNCHVFPFLFLILLDFLNVCVGQSTHTDDALKTSAIQTVDDQTLHLKVLHDIRCCGIKGFERQIALF